MIDPTEADAMKEFHKTNGLCAGAECDHIVHKVMLGVICITNYCSFDYVFIQHQSS